MATTTTLSYNVSDIAGHGCNQPVLFRELIDAGLTPVTVRHDGTTVYVDFASLVTTEEKTLCDTTVMAHQALPFNPTKQSSSDNAEHVVTVGEWATLGTFNSGPLPAGDYVTQWSAEGKVDTEGVGNRIEIRLTMWGTTDPYEASNDALGLPAYQQYQSGAWLPRRAGESFVYYLQARCVGCNGTVRRIRFGMVQGT